MFIFLYIHAGTYDMLESPTLDIGIVIMSESSKNPLSKSQGQKAFDPITRVPISSNLSGFASQ